MSKVTSKYKGKTYVNEANYGAGLIMADVWKDTCDYKVGDIFRIVHRGKKIDNRIHLERVPISDKIKIATIWMHKNNKFIGNYNYCIPIQPILNFIRDRFGYSEFKAKNFTFLIKDSQQDEIIKIMNSLQVEKYKSNFIGGEALKSLVERGLVNEIKTTGRNKYSLSHGKVLK